jgi:hypothetical protein
VLGANGRSEWTHVVVRRTRAVGRGGWGQTGAVTFQRSPVTLMGCRFEGTEAEDALNVLDTDVLLDSVSFTGCRSDAFDGDHVTGEVKSCAFLDGGADGIDVSGATLSIQDCRFERLGDKAFSIGQRSRVRIAGGSAVDVSVGVVSKDESEVEVSGVSIRARNYALAAFVKKLEYGPSRLIARGLTLGEGGLGRAIAQTGCVIELEGTVVPTEDIDVEAAYQDGVLGLPE